MKKYILMALAAVSLTACNDYIDKQPLTSGTDKDFYNKVGDLEVAANQFYEDCLPLNSSLYGGLYEKDTDSDNQMGSSANALFYEGTKVIPSMNNSQAWWFNHMRGINYFINRIEGNQESVTGNLDLVNQYLGEAYFFRAYDTFERLRQLGDIPIVDEMYGDDRDELIELSTRQPRNMVARFIINDLDRACQLLMETAPASGRVSLDAALALKARVALFEATFERYHANTCFVPGNDKWPGAEYHPDFAWPAGSAEAEVNYFLDRAIGAADSVASKRPLNADYISMFNRWESPFGENDEVILARYYASGVIMHSCSAYLKSGGGCGATRAAVQTYLMKNGLPWYAENSGFQGDLTSYEELQDRDERLQQSVRASGEFITGHVDPNTGLNVPDTIYSHKADITRSGVAKATTGYEIDKWVVTNDEDQRLQGKCTSAVPLFRAAECYLVYLEAYYERHYSLGGNCDKYWKALRERAGVSTDYQLTISKTDLSKENDFGTDSHGQKVDVTLYNIRRERRCELFAEGLRLDDLRRWRALDNMKDYQPEGFNLWGGPMKDMYAISELNATTVSQIGDGNYLRPLRTNTTSLAYNGYNFPKPHYLEPIPISELRLTTRPDGTVAIYQNPGWPTTDGTAIYNYDCE
ncbi:MAG: RagB/SusD family nutrient uptake outer membrane protein [Paramuribaculum sp.]|nr:RagB/SusD family nutrient uptake outer membrane protein [Paramuribaculum sp.]